MGAVSLPENIQNDDPLDAGAVMSDFQAITQVVNGSLEADSNVATAAGATQPGSANGEGVAATLARSDHQHILQGFENLAADPTTGNFKGRVYWNTLSNELRYCSDATGSGTFGSFTPTATELVVHAAQHKDGGHDPIADNTITDHMNAAKTIAAASQVGDSADFSTSSWLDIAPDLSVTTTGAQTLLVIAQGRVKNSAGSARSYTLRVTDHTASDAVIFQNTQTDVGVGNSISFCHSFFYTTPSGGARALRLGGAASGANVNLFAPTGHEKTLSAVIL